MKKVPLKSQRKIVWSCVAAYWKLGGCTSAQLDRDEKSHQAKMWKLICGYEVRGVSALGVVDGDVA